MKEQNESEKISIYNEYEDPEIALDIQQNENPIPLQEIDSNNNAKTENLKNEMISAPTINDPRTLLISGGIEKSENHLEKAIEESELPSNNEINETSTVNKEELIANIPNNEIAIPLPDQEVLDNQNHIEKQKSKDLEIAGNRSLQIDKSIEQEIENMLTREISSVNRVNRENPITIIPKMPSVRREFPFLDLTELLRARDHKEFREPFASEAEKSKKVEITFNLFSAEDVMINKLSGVVTSEIKKAYKVIQRIGALLKDKWWVIPLCRIQVCEEELQTILPQLNIHKIPQFVHKMREDDEMVTFNRILERDFRLEENGTVHYSLTQINLEKIVPYSFLERLRNYQKSAVEKGLKLGGRILLSDEKGLGKKLEALGIALSYCVHWPLIIFTHHSKILHWNVLLQKYLPGLTEENILILNENNLFIELKNKKVVICSYKDFERFASALKLFNFKVGIADCSHLLKNLDDQLNVQRVSFLRDLQHVVLLTDPITPQVLSKKNVRGRDLFYIFTILKPQLFSNFKEFGMRYCKSYEPKLTKKMFDSTCNSVELLYLLSLISCQRSRKDVEEEIQKFAITKIPVSVDPAINRRVVKSIKDISMKLGMGPYFGLQNFHFETENEDVLIMESIKEPTSIECEKFQRCYKETGLSKIEAIKSYVETMSESTSKYVFCANNSEILMILENFLNIEHKKFIRIDEITNQRELLTEEERLKMFVEDQSTQIVLTNHNRFPIIMDNLQELESINIVITELSPIDNYLAMAQEKNWRGNMEILVATNGMDVLFTNPKTDKELFAKMLMKIEITEESRKKKPTKDKLYSDLDFGVSNTQKENINQMGRTEMEEAIFLLDDNENFIPSTEKPKIIEPIRKEFFSRKENRDKTNPECLILNEGGNVYVDDIDEDNAEFEFQKKLEIQRAEKYKEERRNALENMRKGRLESAIISSENPIEIIDDNSIEVEGDQEKNGQNEEEETKNDKEQVEKNIRDPANIKSIRLKRTTLTKSKSQSPEKKEEFSEIEIDKDGGESVSSFSISSDSESEKENKKNIISKEDYMKIMEGKTHKSKQKKILPPLPEIQIPINLSGKVDILSSSEDEEASMDSTEYRFAKKQKRYRGHGHDMSNRLIAMNTPQLKIFKATKMKTKRLHRKKGLHKVTREDIEAARRGKYKLEPIKSFAL